MESTKLTKINRKTLGILILVTAITAVAALWQYIFGTRTLSFIDIGSDTSQQYLAQYSSIIEKLRAGDLSLWNENNCFGSNMYMLNMWNPMLMVVYLIGVIFGAQVLPYIMVYWYIAEIVLSGICAYIYLSVFDLDEKAKGIASYMFSFNGFLIIWGQHYQFGIACILFPLLLWSIERLLKEKKTWPAVVIISAVISFNSMYLAYMMFITAALYVIVRIIMIRRFRLLGLIRSGIGVAAPMLLGVGIGMVSILPSYEAISAVSSRLNSSLSLLGRFSGAFNPYPTTYYRTLLDRFVSGTGEGVNKFDGYLNYYEAPCIFFSLLFLVLIVQYVILIFAEKRTAKNRAMHLVCLLLAAAGLFFPAAGIVFNGLTTPFSRYTYLYMPYFLLISAYTLHRLMKGAKLSLIGLAVSAAFIAWRFRAFLYSPGDGSKKVAAVVAAGAVVMFLCLIAYRLLKSEKGRRLASYGVLLALVGTITFETYGNFCVRDTTDKGGEYLTKLENEDDRAAIELIKSEDDGIYRIEKLYGTTWSTDSLLEDYHAVSGYNSTQNRYIINYVNTYWPELYYLDQNHYSYSRSDADPDQTGFTGIKYLIVNHDEENVVPSNAEDYIIDVPSYFTYWKSVGAVDIYKNTLTDSIFSFYSSSEVTKEEGEIPEAAVTYSDRDETAEADFVDQSSSDVAEGTVTVATDGLFVAAIPYEEGWSVTVDGEEATTILVNEGFQGVELTEGTHVVAFTYDCPLFMPSAYVSVASLVLFIALLVIGRLRNKRLTRRA